MEKPEQNSRGTKSRPALFKLRERIVWTAIMLSLAACTVRGNQCAEKAGAREWLLKSQQTSSGPFELRFGRSIPAHNTNDYRLSPRVIKIEWTTQDWFQIEHYADGAFWVGNSLSEAASLNTLWPFLKEYRWAVGYDLTNFWLVRSGKDLTFCPARATDKSSNLRGAVPPPQQFGLGLYSVGSEVLALGIPGVDLETIVWESEQEFSITDLNGRKLWGRLSPIGLGGSQNLSYGVETRTLGHSELAFGLNSSLQGLPSRIRAFLSTDGKEQLRVEYEIISFSQNPSESPMPQTPAPALYAAKGTALLYTNNDRLHLSVSKDGALKRFTVTERNLEQSPSTGGLLLTALRLLLVSLLLAPLFLIWRLLTKKSQHQAHYTSQHKTS